eukprot:scaffold8013_cov124-Isochrysis_galbana.AAC.3
MQSLLGGPLQPTAMKTFAPSPPQGRRSQIDISIAHTFNPLPSTLEQRPHGAALESSRGHSTQPIDIGGDSPPVTLPPWTLSSARTRYKVLPPPLAY